MQEDRSQILKKNDFEMSQIGMVDIMHAVATFRTSKLVGSLINTPDSDNHQANTLCMGRDPRSTRT